VGAAHGRTTAVGVRRRGVRDTIATACGPPLLRHAPPRPPSRPYASAAGYWSRQHAVDFGSTRTAPTPLRRVASDQPAAKPLGDRLAARLGFGNSRLPEKFSLFGSLPRDPFGLLICRQDQQWQIGPAMLFEQLADRQNLNALVVATG